MITKDPVEEVIRTARGLYGTRYTVHPHPHRKLYPPDGLTCFSYVCHVFEIVGVELNDGLFPGGLLHVRDLFKRKDLGTEVPTLNALIQADILFLRGATLLTEGLPSHCGLYLGEGNAAHCSFENGRAEEAPLDVILKDYSFMGARRVI